jgi:hypothetical protein
MDGCLFDHFQTRKFILLQDLPCVGDQEIASSYPTSIHQFIALSANALLFEIKFKRYQSNPLLSGLKMQK